MATLLTIEESRSILTLLKITQIQYDTIFDCLYAYVLESLESYPNMNYGQIFNLEYQGYYVVRDENGYYFMAEMR